jgi:alkanesulfonate monooxygenase SsuD/methylene tetrahydromethanopterin reductase-like flavin-dependent oxidoreductase (luciferase family)
MYSHRQDRASACRLSKVALAAWLLPRRSDHAALRVAGAPGTDQVLAKLHRYAVLGIEAFILSGYPHATECDLFARHVLPHLNHGPLLSSHA